MRRLLIGIENCDGCQIGKESEEQVCKNFKNEFGIDLKAEEYAHGNLEVIWEKLIRDCNRNKHKDKWFEYLHSLEERIYSLLDQNSARLQIGGDIFCRSSEREYQIRQNNIEEVKKFLQECIALVDDYWIYDADVWLNARLTLNYLAGGREKDTGGYVNTEGGTVMDDKGNEYMLPFEDDEKGTFCANFLKQALGKKGCLFWTELGEGEDVEIERFDGDVSLGGNILHRANILLKMDKVYSSFSYNTIYKLEEKLDIEDKVLFHKTVNGVLLRNMVNMMLESKERDVIFDAEDYIDLIDRLCGCKSLVWQNIIACFYVFFQRYKKELKVLDLYADMEMLLSFWLNNIKKINYDLRILTEGFVYLYRRNTYHEEDFKSRCRTHLTYLEQEISKQAKNYWDRQKDSLKVSAAVIRNHTDYCWIYAILQRRTIDTIKKLYRNIDDNGGGFLEQPLLDEWIIEKEDNGGYRVVSVNEFEVTSRSEAVEIGKMESLGKDGRKFRVITVNKMADASRFSADPREAAAELKEMIGKE